MLHFGPTGPAFSRLNLDFGFLTILVERFYHVIMGKYPLIHFDGALFHITARGNDKREIFLDEARDYQRYISALEKCKKKLPFRLYAFVLMPNHLHLLIEVHKHSIDKIMQVVQTAYTMYFNKKYHHVGHLFQGRYRSFLVDKENYLLVLIRYIHLNPVRAGFVKNPVDYQWSSHHGFLDENHIFNKVLDRDFVLSQFSQDPRKQKDEYKNFILTGVEEEKWKDIFPKTTWGQIIGSDKFIHFMERKIKKLSKKSFI